MGSAGQRAAALRHVAQRPGARRHHRGVEGPAGRLPRALPQRDRLHRQRHARGGAPRGERHHRALGAHEGQLRAGRGAPRAGEGARAPAGRVRRRARRRPPGAGRRFQPHRRVRGRPRGAGRGGPARDHGRVRLRHRARGALLQRGRVRAAVTARGPAPDPAGGVELRLPDRGQRHPAPPRGHRCVRSRCPAVPGRRHPPAHQGHHARRCRRRRRRSGRVPTRSPSGCGPRTPGTPRRPRRMPSTAR